ncbi:hypothetical protein FRACA_2450003 [Frankia canadensis]|uniref:Uncharacterized protein n=1 Tax=Frankia canadensis TaxID=1836972 RepID=A0A2I2KRW4_9ACTN|nr:hypothetical protein FRACA_2450003 [Frankia canadensis]SOU55679.1 hypothetical protein FRACA_2450003 [Frankia canadensis]
MTCRNSQSKLGAQRLNRICQSYDHLSHDNLSSDRFEQPLNILSCRYFPQISWLNCYVDVGYLGTHYPLSGCH